MMVSRWKIETTGILAEDGPGSNITKVEAKELDQIWSGPLLEGRALAKLTEWGLQKVNFTKDCKDGPQKRSLTKTKNLYQKATNNRHNGIVVCQKVIDLKGEKSVRLCSKGTTCSHLQWACHVSRQ